MRNSVPERRAAVRAHPTPLLRFVSLPRAVVPFVVPFVVTGAQMCGCSGSTTERETPLQTGSASTAASPAASPGTDSTSAQGSATESSTVASTTTVPSSDATGEVTPSSEGAGGSGGETSTLGAGGSAGDGAGGGAGGSSDAAGGSGGMMDSAPPDGQELTLTSPAFDAVAECSTDNPESCGVFPDENISFMESPNLSPQLDWAGVPEGTQSFAVVLEDVSFGQTHWALWNIPGDLTTLPAAVAQDSSMPENVPGAAQSNATFAEGDGYYGPQAECNVYRFTLYALAMPQFTPSQPDFVTLVRDEILALGDDVLLAQATLSARSNYMNACE